MTSRRGIDFDISLLVAALHLAREQTKDKFASTVLTRAIWAIVRWEEIETHARLLVGEILDSDDDSVNRVRTEYIQKLLSTKAK